jgi:hypothetical protein
MFREIIIPDNIEIKIYPKGISIYSKKKYNIGDIIYSNTSELFDSNKDKKITVKLYSKIFDIDILSHTVNRGNNIREFYGFDSFVNHSCDPNTEIIGGLTSKDNNLNYTSMDISTLTSYDVIAKKNISIGDELMQDYSTFDPMLDQTEFICECGSNICKNIIYG